MEPEPNNNSIIKKSITGVLTLGLIAGVGMYLSQTKNKDENAQKEETVTTTVPSPAPTNQATIPTVISNNTVTSSLLYKNGSYSAIGTYTSPGGKDVVNISLTLKDDLVTEATFSGQASNPASKNWQETFSKGFTQVVVGKKIEELNLTVVNGSSLTSKGFMDALVTIKAEAKI